MRKRRAASQMAENERQKYVANVKKQQAIHESKKQAIQKEYAKREKPLYKATRPFVTNWKIGANEIKRTASKGASFVKNLFK